MNTFDIKKSITTDDELFGYYNFPDKGSSHYENPIAWIAMTVAAPITTVATTVESEVLQAPQNASRVNRNHGSRRLIENVFFQKRLIAALS